MGGSIGWNYHGGQLVKQQVDQPFHSPIFNNCIEENQDEDNYYSTPKDLEVSTKRKQRKQRKK